MPDRRPPLIDESRIPGMTREKLHDLLVPALEWYQALPRRTARQEAEYDRLWRLFRRYFHPSDAIGAALDYVQTGNDSYWAGPATPREATHA